MSQQTKQSYTIRFRGFVKDLTTRHELIIQESKKRNYEDSFGSREYEIERYGQEIDDGFFQTHDDAQAVYTDKEHDSNSNTMNPLTLNNSWIRNTQ